MKRPFVALRNEGIEEQVKEMEDMLSTLKPKANLELRNLGSRIEGTFTTEYFLALTMEEKITFVQRLNSHCDHIVEKFPLTTAIKV